MKVLMFVIAFIKIIGFIMNVKKISAGYILWGATDLVLIWHNYNIGEYGQMTLWISNCCLAIWGFTQWKKNVLPHEN